MARIHGSNLCHACSVGDTSGGSRYFLDQSTEDTNHYPTGLDKNHNFPDVITSCGSSAHRYLAPCSSHFYGHCPSCAALSTLLVWSFPRKTCRSFWGIWLFYWLEFNYLDKLTIQVSLRSVYWTVFFDDLVGGLKVKVESIKAGDICKIITWHYWLIGSYLLRIVRHTTTPNPKGQESVMMNDGRNFFIWLIFMVAIFIILGVLETALEVPDIG